MALPDLVTLPPRLASAAAQTTLALGDLVAPQGPVRRPGGYADRVMLVIGEGGMAERLERVLSDPHGAVHLVNTVTSVLDAGRPLGRALAPGGTIDRLLDADGPMFRMLAEGGSLVPELHESVDTLSRAVGPLAELANRIPGGRRRQALEA
jgi:hypothetical protein